jgi:tripartite-type tricarboxylate transporter receptor subunit TctC
LATAVVSNSLAPECRFIKRAAGNDHPFSQRRNNMNLSAFARYARASVFVAISSVLYPLQASASGIAENYPNKPVRIVVPVAAGGSADKLTRIIAERLSVRWGQSVTVENVAGASGIIGAEKVAKSKPDGYVILQAGEGLVLNGILFSDLPYDAKRAFAPVVKAVVNPQVLVVNPKSGIKNFQDYVAYNKNHPGKLSLALPGLGGIAHVGHELLNRETGGQVNYIPYRGGGPAAVDVIAGHVDATLITLAAVTEYVKAGKLTALAVTTPYRSKALPNVPTMAETGVPNFKVESWQGYVVPTGTPPEIISKLHHDIAKVLGEPEVRSRLEDMGFGVTGASPAELEATLKSEEATYGKVIRTAGITVQ